MNFTGADFRKLALPIALALVLGAVGAALIWFSNKQLVASNAVLAAVKTERTEARARLARISDEERDA